MRPCRKCYTLVYFFYMCPHVSIGKILSIVIAAGDETLANDLRALTAAELYINTEYYTRHPHIRLVTSNPEFAISAENIHGLLLTAKGSKAFEETGNLKETICCGKRNMHKGKLVFLYSFTCSVIFAETEHLIGLSNEHA